MLFETVDPLVGVWAGCELSSTRYPIYIPSLGRAETSVTPTLLSDYRMVVEDHEYEAYVDRFGVEKVLALPGHGYGTISFVRNWIKEHARAEGHTYHWQLDDNIFKIKSHFKVDGKSKYVQMPAHFVLGRVERFVEQFSNIGIAGLQHSAFAWASKAPFLLNKQVYSCVLVADNHLRWRRDLIDDTDYSLQVLSDRLCTVLFSEYVIDKAKTESMAGGNTSNIYQGDGRLKVRAERWRSAGGGEHPGQ